MEIKVIKFKLLKFLKLIACIVIFIMLFRLTVRVFDQKGRRNSINLTHVQVGMPLEKALEIMGEPERIWHIEDEYKYEYDSEFAMSDAYYLYVNKEEDKVIGIGYGL
jgi:hypothetical protein